MKPIYATIVGSKLYGISTPQSDIDFKGYGFEDPDAIVGLKRVEQQEYKNDVKEGPNKIEGVCYTVKQYLHLALKGNPTIVELVFANDKYHVITSDIGKEIYEFGRKHFLTKHLFKPYSAYHMAQIRKLQNTVPIGSRKEMHDIYGFDVKFGSHAYRLARQCVIVMEEGILRPTLDPQDKEIALAIRQGKYSKEDCLDLLHKVDRQMKEAYGKSTLPAMPDYNIVNKFCCDVYMRYLNGKFDSELQKLQNDDNIMKQVTEFHQTPN